MKKMDSSLKSQTLTGLLWSFLERAGTQLVSFVVSIILARILLPEDYGVIAIVLVFISFLDVFVQAGFGSALIQKKEVDEYDLSSIFWVSLATSIILYLLLFLFAPYVAKFYDMPILSPILRVLGLRLPISSYNTVQRALVSRSMRFKAYFYASIIGILVSAVVGIIMAYREFGVWALVWQQLVNTVVGSLVVLFIIRWFPHALFDINRVKTLFSFGWKVLIGGLIDTIYEDFRSLYVGKLYTPADLAYFTRGKQFPYLIVSNVNTSISNVLFPVLSKKQDDSASVKAMTRRAIKTSSFIMMPIMFGLAAVAEPLVLALLTEKWLPCVPFVQILCFNAALMPLQTANLQAIYAMGRSDIALRLNIIKKSSGFVIILVTATFSVLAMAWGGVLVAIIASIVNAWPNKKLLDYSYWEQIKDILPFIGVSMLMCMCVLLCNKLPINSSTLMLFLQIVIGAISYYLFAWLLKLETFKYMKEAFLRYL